VRVEDLDPPREVAGASERQLRTLEAFGFESDAPVLRQSDRGDLYQQALDRLLSNGDAFLCHCSRSDLATDAGVHRQCVSGAHRRQPAIRFRVPPGTVVRFEDAVQGPVEQRVDLAVGDFVLLSGDIHPVIETVLPRRTLLVRAAAGERYERQVIAANIDYVLVLMGLDGDFNPTRIERYLSLVEGSGAQPVVLLSKADSAPDPQASVAAVHERLGHATPVIALNIIATLHVIGGTMLGIALWRTRVVPVWAAVAATLAQPIHFVSNIAGILWIDAMTWIALAAAFGSVAAVVLQPSADAAP